MTIPPVIHQMWIDRHSDTNEQVPTKYTDLGYVQSWATVNPTFEYRFWNGQRVKQLFQHPSLFRWKYFWENTINTTIERCDFARYAIMLVHGGVYADLDFLCLKELGPLLQEREIGLVWEPIEHGDSEQGVKRRLYNGFFMSVPGHYVWAQYMDYVMQHYQANRGPIDNTGPNAFAKFAIESGIDRQTSYFIDTCLVLPVQGAGNRKVSSECRDDPDYKQAYTVTFWDEGTGWHATILEERFGQQAKAMSTNPLAYGLYGFLAFLIVVGVVIAVSRRKRHKSSTVRTEAHQASA